MWRTRLDDDFDASVRQQAFELLADLTLQHGEVLPWKPLSDGFQVRGKRVPLVAPQGIFKPAILDLPLTITTSPDSPYDDAFTDDGLLQYRYRGTDPTHRDNVGLRRLMTTRKPLVYLHGVSKGKYLAAWPVYIVGDDPDSLTFRVAVDDSRQVDVPISEVAEPEQDFRRRYITSEVKVRLHQRLFRERVLAAYKNQCALCRLKHTKLLEAAHITPDSAADGEPVVSNGLSLCTIHHSAFDVNILGITPSYVVEIRSDILKEVDGPMLKHGIQAMHGTRISIPRSKVDHPDKLALEKRYEKFLAA